jgi:cell division transport system permease protein
MKAYLLRHVQTLLGACGRIAAQPIASVMTMGVIAIAIALPLTLYVFLQNAQSAAAGWSAAFEISVYLDKAATGARAEAIAATLRGREDVVAVRVISPAAALAEFREYSGLGAALDALPVNPLPTTLIVTPSVAASTTQRLAALHSAIAALSDVAGVELDTEWVERLLAILALLRRVVLVTGGLLGAGVILIVGNTIRLDILNRRAEIEVVKLVGGSDGFARRPFLYTGLFYGIGGGIAAVGLVGLATAFIATPVARVAGLYGSHFEFAGLEWSNAAQVLLLAGALGWAGSWIAASQHIRGINPS